MLILNDDVTVCYER